MAVRFAVVMAFMTLLKRSSAYSTELGDQTSTDFHVGGWLPGSKPYIESSLTPLLDKYLNTEVGSQFNPPLRFYFRAVDYSLESYSTDELRDGELDFLYSLSGRLACLEPEHGWTALATQRAYVAGKETGAQGSIIFSLLSNDNIKNISDFRNKRIGIGFVLSGNAYTLAVQAIRNQGVNIFTDTAQIVFFDVDFESHFQAVLTGAVDVGILPASWLYASHASYIPQLRVHNPSQQIWQGEPFPMVTSTALVPQYSLSVAPFVPLRVKQAVADALFRLNSTHPAAIKLGIAGFSVPATYAQARSQLQQMGLLTTNFKGGEGGTCINPFESLLNTLSCPVGYVRQTEEIQSVQCQNDGLACPDSAICYCKPCVPDHEIRVFPAKTVLALCITSLSLALLLSAGWVLCLESSAAAEEMMKAASRAARRQMVELERRGGGRRGCGRGCY